MVGFLGAFLVWFAGTTSFASDCADNLTAPPTYADVAPIFQNKCAICHRSPALDLSAFPFTYFRTTDQKQMVQEFLRRMRLPSENWGRMPTRNAIGMSEAEIEVIQQWLDGGLEPGP